MKMILTSDYYKKLIVCQDMNDHIMLWFFEVFQAKLENIEISNTWIILTQRRKDAKKLFDIIAPQRAGERFILKPGLRYYEYDTLRLLNST